MSLRLKFPILVFLAALGLKRVPAQSSAVTAQLQLYTGDQQAGPTDGGSCGYGPTVLSNAQWPHGYFASVNSESPVVSGLGSNGCGACLLITYPAESAPNKTLTVLVVDASPASSFAVTSGHFAELAPTRLGDITVDVKQVPCRPDDNIALEILQLRPSLGGYLKLSFLNVAGGGALSSVSLRKYGTDGPFQQLNNTYGAVFEATSLPGFPLDMQLVSGGDRIIIQGVISQTSSGTIPTIYQFPLAAAPGSAPLPAVVAPSPDRIPGALAPGPVATVLPQTAAPAPTPISGLGTGPGGCSTVLAVLQSQPSLSSWLGWLLENGDGPALGNVDLKLTMLAPNNQAWNTTFPGMSQTATQLLDGNAALLAPLAGYHIVSDSYNSSALTQGVTLQTTDYTKAPDGTNFPLTIAVEAGGVLQGYGSSATIVTPNLLACGSPSVVHIIDTVLLPVNLTTPAA